MIRERTIILPAANDLEPGRVFSPRIQRSLLVASSLVRACHDGHVPQENLLALHAADMRRFDAVMGVIR